MSPQTSSTVNRCGLSGGVSRRERLRTGGLLPWNIARRHGSLFNGIDRLTGVPVEHEQHARLGRLHDGWPAYTVACDGDQGRRRRVVVVPQIVVDRLEIPYPLPVEARSATIELA